MLSRPQFVGAESKLVHGRCVESVRGFGSLPSEICFEWRAREEGDESAEEEEILPIPLLFGKLSVQTHLIDQLTLRSRSIKSI